MAHVGLTPQAVNTLGGYAARVVAARKSMKRSLHGCKSGGRCRRLSRWSWKACSNRLPLPLTRSVDIPVIGIGASAQCDGQVLVTEDMLGMFERTARFVKRYHNISEQIEQAAGEYAEDVRNRSFPGPDQLYQPKK